MPLWQIFHHPSAFSEADKQGLSKAITNIYSSLINLPDFYAIVVFNPSEDIYMGGEKTTNFVRFRVDHLARVSSTDEDRVKGFQSAIDAALKPYVADRGLDWEYSYDNSPRQFWKINGVTPPAEGSAGEKLWKEKNKPVPYEHCL